MSIQMLAFWSCGPAIIYEIMTGVTLNPYTVIYQDSLQRYELQQEVLSNDTNTYLYNEIGWSFSEQFSFVKNQIRPSLLAPMASTAYAFQKTQVYHRLQKLVSRKVYTINDYNANFPALSDITAICNTSLGLPFGDISKRIEDADYHFYHFQTDFFILQEAPSSPREVTLRIVYEYENDEIYQTTTSALIMQ